MKTAFYSGGISELKTDLLVFCVQDNENEWTGTLAEVNELLGGLLMEVAKEEGFTGKGDTQLLLHTHGRLGAGRVGLLGVGKEAKMGASLRNVAARAVQMADPLGLQSVAVVATAEADNTSAIGFLFEGAALGLYRFDRYFTQDNKPVAVTDFRVALEGDEGLVELDDTVCAQAGALSAQVAQAVDLARDLVNEGPREMTPQRMAEVAETIAAEEGLECTIFGMEEIQQRKMELILAVNAGSDLDPRLIHLTYRPEGADENTPVIAFVGKGLTFDAGGYNLKPTGAIDDMKIDMAGGAAVLGAMKAIKAVAPNCIVHGIVPSTENLVNGSAMKLGDVYHGQNGKTVEIRNTDAEGRLILADALCYAESQGVDEMFTLATLTGACVVALGPYTCGVFGSDQNMVDDVLEVSASAGEDVWQLPLNGKLKSMLKSDVADLKNVGERWGGAITAALFLQEFVDEAKWVHMDLAGPSYLAKSAESHIPKGGTGFGVLTLLAYAVARGAQSRD
jgi:leucyl aminopeptidase